jgi:hypothetical protein
MHATFFQKIILTLIAGFFAACLVEFYKNIIIAGDQSVNGGFNNRGGISSPK